jgi:hypothetical protein
VVPYYKSQEMRSIVNKFQVVYVLSLSMRSFIMSLDYLKCLIDAYPSAGSGGRSGGTWAVLDHDVPMWRRVVYLPLSSYTRTPPLPLGCTTSITHRQSYSLFVR